MIKSLKEYTWKCLYCNEVFRTRKEKQDHYNKNPEHRTNHKYKNKKEYICEYCNKKWITTLEGFKNHINHCDKNPNKRNGPWSGKLHSEESKSKISNTMKRLHKEGKAWNIGMSRWNNKPSYPESFFMKVITNEFIDKNYKYEYNIGIYSLDFAWISKKKYIEIDGDQHQRFKEIQERDKRKDKYCKSKGWKVLRIKWKDLFNNTKSWIKIANDFIGE